MSHESAQPCGCDAAIDWLCQRHAQEIAECTYGERVERMNMEQFAVDAEPDLSFHGTVTGNVAVEQEPPDLDIDNLASLWTTEDLLRGEFPHGHWQFLPTVLKQLELHSQKSHDYSKGGDPLGNFKRVAAILALYPKLNLADPRVVAMVYSLKQMDAVLWGLSEQIVQKVEGLNPRLDDVSNYATLVQCMNSEVVG